MSEPANLMEKILVEKPDGRRVHTTLRKAAQTGKKAVAEKQEFVMRNLWLESYTQKMTIIPGRQTNWQKLKFKQNVTSLSC